MFLALERRISDRSMSPAGGEPTATARGAAGAARAADVPAGSATNKGGRGNKNAVTKAADQARRAALLEARREVERAGGS